MLSVGKFPPVGLVGIVISSALAGILAGLQLLAVPQAVVVPTQVFTPENASAPRIIVMSVKREKTVILFIEYPLLFGEEKTLSYTGRKIVPLP